MEDYQFSPLFQLFSNDAADLSRKDRYCLCAEMLPSYIPTRVAEKILFVGESVQIFESQKGRLQRHRGTPIILKWTFHFFFFFLVFVFFCYFQSPAGINMEKNFKL